MRTLMWFREDLRTFDNKALYNASKSSHDGMIAVFFITYKIWKKKEYGDIKIDFILRNLKTLSSSLKKRNIPLLIKTANTHKDIQKKLLKIAIDNKIDAIYFNKRYYDISDCNDETELLNLFNKHNKKVFTFDDETILPPKSVLNKQQKFYSIFTPFKKQWINVFKKNQSTVLGTPKKQKKTFCKSDLSQIKLNKKIDPKIRKLWPAGEKEANIRLRKFIKHNIKKYDVTRDYPSLDSTSKLSPYLACGVISPRKCLKEALKINQKKIDTGNKGIITWIEELIWRDFYKHLSFAYPRLNKKEPFKKYTNKIKWKKNKNLLNKWKKGETGFPIIDASMNQLNKTGWMHNRLRMITASFLTKLLFIDWRLGESYFAENLIDYDFSANNGGWQWSASTGADSVPYFRIFNPDLQQKKYDSKNIFIKSYCKECEKNKPIINYKKARDFALKSFKKSVINK